MRDQIVIFSLYSSRHAILPVLLREVLIATTENGKTSTAADHQSDRSLGDDDRLAVAAALAG